MSKQILTLYYNRIFIICIFLFAITNSYSQEATIELPKMADQPINDFTQVAISNNYDNDFKSVTKLNFTPSKEFGKTFKVFPPETKSTWVKFQIKNNYKKDTTFYFKCYTSEFYVFKLFNKTLKLVGTAGVNQKNDKLLIQDDFNRVKLNLQANATALFYFQSFSYVYINHIPEIKIEETLTFLKEKKNYFSEDYYKINKLAIILLGMHVVFLILGLFRIYNYRKEKAYFYFVALNITSLIFYITNFKLFSLENNLFPFLSNYELGTYSNTLEPIAYYMFFRSFLKLAEDSFLNKFLKYISLFWVLFFVVEISDFSNYYLIQISLLINYLAGFVDVLVVLIVLFYAYKSKTRLYTLAKYGVTFLFMGRFIIFILRLDTIFGFNVNFIESQTVSVFANRIINLIDFTFFFFALSIIDRNNENEITEITETYNQTKKELETTKKLIENDSILLKDKTIITLETLIYIKADDHYLEICTNDHNKNHQVRGKLSEILKELPPNFIKCHRSYIINKNYIKQMQTSTIVMTNNSEIPISRGFILED